jgi:DNA-binding NarL/FixJ family response regulator
MASGEAQRVLVVDDHQMFVQLLSSALSAQPDLECVGVAYDISAALERARELRPDLIVMDVRLGDGDGIAAARELVAEHPDTRVVVLTAFVDTRLVQRAADAGVSALLAKDGEIDNLMDAIRHAERGSFISGHGVPEVQQQPEDRFTAIGLAPEDGVLLRLLATGLDVEGVARELGVEPRVARQRIQHVQSTLGARSSAEAVSAAVRRGLLKVGT